MRRLLYLLAGLVVLGLPAGASAEGACPNKALREAQSSTFLAGCRAYEMVSPAGKGGVDIAGDPKRTRAAGSGDAVQYLSFTPMGEATGSDALGAEYLAQRGPGGWASHEIVPPQRPPGFPPASSMYVGDFTEDLNAGVFFAISPLTSDPDVAVAYNLYLRRDLLSPGSGSYQLLTACPGCSSPLPPPPISLEPPHDPVFAGASGDFTHVIFETSRNLTPDASGAEVKLYESVNGAVRLAGVLPDSACASPPCVAEASEGGAGGALLLRNAISRDGSRIVFTAGGAIYVRENGTTTTKLDASERTPADEPQAATFMAATPDGLKVLFVTAEKLTSDAASSRPNLYMYDASAPAGHHLTLISKSDEPSVSEGLFAVGLSEDGHYVYFTSGNGRLVANQSGTEGLNNLYVWHDGTRRLVGVGASLSSTHSCELSWGEQHDNYNSYSSGLGAYMSPNGKTIAFVTTNPEMAEALGYGNPESPACSEPYREVYVYNYDTNHVACVSCDQNGAAPLGNAGLAQPVDSGLKFARTTHAGHFVTSDGGKMFFDSPDPLLPQDVNGQMDVYEYDVSSGALHLISSGRAATDSLFMDASPDGSDVFIATRQQLVNADVDNNVDLYDARVDGGIAAQNVPLVAGCVADDCQGILAAAPALAVPASAAVLGGGNLLPVSAAPAAKAKAKVKPRKRHGSKRRRATKRRRKAKSRVSATHTAHRAGR